MGSKLFKLRSKFFKLGSTLLKIGSTPLKLGTKLKNLEQNCKIWNNETYKMCKKNFKVGNKTPKMGSQLLKLGTNETYSILFVSVHRLRPIMSLLLSTSLEVRTERIYI